MMIPSVLRVLVRLVLFGALFVSCLDSTRAQGAPAGADTLAADDTTSPSPNDGRFRIAVGGVAFTRYDPDDQPMMWYFGLNYRYSLLTRGSGVRLGLGLEAGLHYIFAAYVEVGPEIRFRDWWVELAVAGATAPGFTATGHGNPSAWFGQYVTVTAGLAPISALDLEMSVVRSLTDFSPGSPFFDTTLMLTASVAFR